MLITTSRRPGRLSKVFCRNLSRVVPGSFYLPRGLKTIEEVATAARGLQQSKVIFVESFLGGSRVLRFLEVNNGWRWANVIFEIRDVNVRRDSGKKSKLKTLKIRADGKTTLEFAEWFGKILGVEISEKSLDFGGVVVVTSEGGLRVQFKIMPGSVPIGPSFLVVAFGDLAAGVANGEG